MSEQLIIAESGNFEKIFYSAMKWPGIRVNRANFLQKELSKYFTEDIVEKAVATNPAQAGLSVKSLKPIAKSCINYETTKVTSVSAAAGVPGGFAMVATVPADIIQFYGHVIRVLQKLVYLYGWDEIFRGNEDLLDDETSNELILFMGVMFGVNAANAAITKIAAAAASKAERVLVQKALTKGTIYPIVKKVAKLIGFKMTKQIFAKGIEKIIPVMGAIASGGITFLGFKPMANRLQKYLIALPIANVEFYKNGPASYDDIEAIDFSDIVVKDDTLEGIIE